MLKFDDIYIWYIILFYELIKDWNLELISSDYQNVFVLLTNLI
jgi:hypothetical protein